MTNYVMTRDVVTYRVEGINGLGMFGENYPMWAFNSEKADKINKSFNKIAGMYREFEHLEDLSSFYCAFKDLYHTLEILPFDLLEYLVKSGLKVVEIRGKVVVGRTQVVFKPREVKKKVISIAQLKNKLAKEIAKEHLKEEFKVLSVHNYLILD